MCKKPLPIWFCMKKTRVLWKLRQHSDPCGASWFPSCVLLLFQDFGQANGHVNTQQAWDSDSTAICFFFHLQMSHQEVQPNPPFRGIPKAAKFTVVAPAGWPFTARVSEQGLAAWLLAMNTHARNMVLHSSKWQSFSCTTLCFTLAAAIHLISLWHRLGSLWSNSHWAADVFHQATRSTAQDCLHQRTLDKEVFQNNQLRAEPLVITIKFLLVILVQSSGWSDCVLFLLLMSMIWSPTLLSLHLDVQFSLSWWMSPCFCIIY